MKFLELQIKGFGRFHGQTISFEDGINVVYGKNETGKSTMHTFIRGMLFGIQPQRGRSAKNDLYSKYEPWENSGTYEGALRVEYGGCIYRIERSFQKTKRELRIIDETCGKESDTPKALLEEMLGGLSETAYNNTVSIGQLKSATDSGMVTELKNYIANMNTTGNMALNISKATDYLKKQRKQLELQMVPQAARTYTSLLGEIKTIEKEISDPEYENHLCDYQKKRNQVKTAADEKQTEKETLIQKSAQEKQILSQAQFTDVSSIENYEKQAARLYEEYQTSKAAVSKSSRKVMAILPLVCTVLSLICAGCFYFLKESNPISLYLHLPPEVAILIPIGFAWIFLFINLIVFLNTQRLKKELSLSGQVLQETFSRHLGDASLTPKAYDAFLKKMKEFKQLCVSAIDTDHSVQQLTEEIDALQKEQDNCSETIERQQKKQWELEKKLELAAEYKTQAEGLKNTLAENERISQELAAIDLALETMTELSASIRDSFGLHLNKTASELISGITGGIYTSMSIDENLNAYMNTRTRLIPIDQVSSGTMDQIYLALRLAAARLIQGTHEPLPLIFDDSFVLYDDDRLRSVLRWLYSTYDGQIVLFTCHQREAQMLTANQLPYHLITLQPRVLNS